MNNDFPYTKKQIIKACFDAIANGRKPNSLGAMISVFKNKRRDDWTVIDNRERFSQSFYDSVLEWHRTAPVRTTTEDPRESENAEGLMTVAELQFFYLTHYSRDGIADSTLRSLMSRNGVDGSMKKNTNGRLVQAYPKQQALDAFRKIYGEPRQVQTQERLSLVSEPVQTLQNADPVNAVTINLTTKNWHRIRRLESAGGDAHTYINRLINNDYGACDD